GVEHFRYTVEDAGGQRVAISRRLADVRGIGLLVGRELLRHKLPGALEAHARGEAIPFGPVTVTGAGLATASGTIPSSSIHAVRIDARELVVWERGASAPRARFAVRKLPNVDILAALVAKHATVTR